MPLAGCMPSPGNYVCGPNATTNLYHDFEQTPRGDCGVGVECGEYVFDHRNASVRTFFLGDYFFPQPFPKSVTGCASSPRAAPLPLPRSHFTPPLPLSSLLPPLSPRLRR